MTTALDETRFMSLRIAAADDVADGIRRFELVDPAGHDLPGVNAGSSPPSGATSSNSRTSRATVAAARTRTVPTSSGLSASRIDHRQCRGASNVRGASRWINGGGFERDR